MSQKRARAARRSVATEQPKAPERRTVRVSRSRLWLGAAGAAVVVLVAVGVILARGTGPAQAVRTSSGGAVSLSGTDPITGKSVSVADYAGKPVVLNVWASWCPGCNEEAADLRTFVERHPDVQVIGIDTQDSKGGARGFYDKWGWRHPSISDPGGSIASSLGLQGLPTTFFLDRGHRIVTQIVGATDLAGFEQGLDTALSGA